MTNKSIIRCIIADDEPLAHELIINYIDQLDHIICVAQAYTGAEALKLIQTHDVDLIFLDIKMPKLTGLQLAKTLNGKPLIIFTTAYEEHALESYELNAIDYLLKPFRLERFIKAVNKASDVLNKNESSDRNSEAQLYIKVDKKWMHLQTDDISHLESYGNYVKVWIKDKFHLTPRTMSSFEDQLDQSKFYRLHKSFIINKSMIDYIEGYTVLMKNGILIPVGKNQRKDFKQILISHK